MTQRMAYLFAAAALSLTAAPALAQDDWEYGVPPLPALDEPAGEPWESDWEPDDVEKDEALADYIDERHPGGPWQTEFRDHRRGRGVAGVDYRGEHPRFAYSERERADWLDQCRHQQSYYDDGARERGAVIGGTLGAIGGGVVGNRIAGRGDRLEGTLLGAGVGAVAGAVLGSAIGTRDGERGIDFCEDYLERYEASISGQGHYYGPGAPYAAPVMWVRVPIVRERRGCGCKVVEEIIEEEVRTPVVRARRVVAKPDKRIRYSK